MGSQARGHSSAHREGARGAGCTGHREACTGSVHGAVFCTGGPHGVVGTGWVVQGARMEQCARGGLHRVVCTNGVHGSLCTPVSIYFFCDRYSWNGSPWGAHGGGGGRTAGCSPAIPVRPASWPARPRPHPSTHSGPATAPLIKRGWSQGRFLLMYHCQAGQTARGPRPSSSSRISRHPEHRGLLGTTAPQGWQKYSRLISC